MVMVVLIALSITGGVVGLTMLSGDTRGLGILVFSCLLAIVARVLQADATYRKLSRAAIDIIHNLNAREADVD
ncbi:MAG: hypothetical protein ACYC4R_11000 [Anaerolineae bacterium]